ncbi:uncharacterized protein LOC133840544 [Drosophila sulfurigaster albostrigata]|uniref:uncharacterized protein LOC133840544 n=1 Tax=Drosophila sulfurigaster albostrigata TaxID=89887 RepID=UPI002D21D2D6|nr:uncharacterized protein LOC133840544 [Drosophila sulfurigaster albostrigata]
MEDIFSIECDPKQMQAITTLSELQYLPCEDVVDRVSQQTALEICKRSLNNLSVKHVELLSLWLTKLLKAYFSKTVCCIEAFKYLYVWFTKLKDEVTSENKTGCDNFYKLLTDALDFAEWAKGKLAKISERLGHATAYFLLSIVSTCLQQSIEKDMQALKEHETIAIKLHVTVLALLKEITKNANTIHARITPMLQQLIAITDFLYAKMSHWNAFVNTSKTMTNICKHYSNYADLSQSTPEWLRETLLHICDTVLNIQELAKKDGSVEYLKVIQVYMIMLHNLLDCGIKHLDKTVLDSITLLLIGGEFLSSCDLHKEMPKQLLLLPYVMSVYGLIYKLEDFQNYLLRCLADQENKTNNYTKLCLNYTTTVVLDDAEITPLTIKVVQNLFEYLLKDSRNFVNAAHYDRILQTFATLLHVSHSVALFKFFSAGIFQEDLMKQQVCADVLMLFFRLEETSKNWKSADIAQAAEYYRECNNSYAMFSQNTSQWHVQRMLKYFHKLERKEAPLFNLRNYNYLHCVSPRAEPDQRMWMMRLQRLLMSPFSDIEQYYEMLALMELLATDSNNWLHLLPDTVMNIINRGKCQLLRKVYFKLAFQSNQLTRKRLLQEAMPTQDNVNNSWHLQKLLYAGQCSDDKEFKSLASMRPISADLLPILSALHLAQFNDQGASVLENNLYEWDYKRTEKHRCNFGGQKRKRSNQLKDLIRQIERNTNELLDYANEFDASDLQQLGEIIKNMNQFSLT